MKKVLMSAALVWVGAAALWAQAGTGTTASRPQSATAPRASSPAPAPASSTPGRTQTASAVQAPAAPDQTAKYQAWVKQYCISCHNSRTASPANEPVNLETASLTNLLPQAATWERVLRKLSVRAMPPQGMPHPTEAEYVGFTTWLANSLDRAWMGKSTPGRYVVHRLNRTEYANAIRDLLALDIDVTELLPSDGANFGFDNIASALGTSPLLLERYLTAAQRISTLAVGDPNVRPGTTEYPISREFSQSLHVEGLPLGTRGGTVVSHVFPADAEYKLFGRLVRGVEEGYAGVEGNETPDTFIITIDGEEVYSAEVGGKKDHEVQAKDMNEAKALLDARMTGKVFVTAGPHEVGFTWKERPARRQDVWQPALRDSQEVHMIGGLARLRTVGVEGPYNVKGISMSASRDRLFVCKPASAADESALASAKGSAESRRSAPTIRASEDGCAEKILTNLARRAYRRPVNTADVEAPMTFYKQAREDNGSFDAGIRAGVARILASPSFLYRIERDPVGVRAGVAHPVSDVELASRLSFFLWSSIPDQTLMNLAVAGRLRQPGVLASQVKRMIADERADALINNFTGQWLQLRNLESKVAPDLLMFPDFDDNIRKAFRRETELFFGHVLRQNRSAMELLSADYTFVNERLAKHYGIAGVYGSKFRQVKLADPNRRGLLGQGSILSLTSVATRTSPVFRGKFILTTFLNTPPPPPLPNVPTLEESNKDAAPKTVREQLERHRNNPVCASCHRIIDPAGFALEKFNSVGQWREVTETGATIDTGGVLADGSKVDGPIALRNAILSRPEAFATVLTERLLTYALGRGVEPSDMPVVRSIVKKTAPNSYRLSSIVMSIVESAPFQMRTRLEPAETPNRVAQSLPERPVSIP
jgi:mono/diheme cytochrome c family protein